MAIRFATALSNFIRGLTQDCSNQFRTAGSYRRARQRLAPALAAASLALLSACATSGPHVSATAEARYYAARAPGDYTPPGPAADPWGPYIHRASARFNVPQQWIRQVMRVESGGNEYMNGHLTISHAGAMGLMQLEPGTYQEMAARYGLGNDPFNPYDNIMAGAAYIREMYEIYGSPGFLAAYNAGPGRLDDYLDYHAPLPDETRNYVAMIGPRIEGVYPSRQSEGERLAMNRIPVDIAPGLRQDDGDGTAALNAQSLRDHALPAPILASTPAPARVMVAAAVPALPAPVQPAPVSSVLAAPVPLPAPDRAPPRAPIELAALAPPQAIERARYTPPSALPPPHPVASRSVRLRYAALLRHATRHRFALIPAAEAAPPREETLALNTGSGWAVQVGAYDSQAKARAALGIAEMSAVSALVHGQAVVNSVHTAHGLFYRARFVNLPHQMAVNACNRLAGGATGCMVISPDAQS